MPGDLLSGQLNSLVFVDTETTGLNPSVDRVFEIGIIVVKDGEIVQKYSKLIDPTIKIPEECYKMTGVKKKELKGAPIFSEIKNEVFDLLRSGLFVAHNAKFDYDFLEMEFKKVDIPFSVPSLCTVKLTRALYPYFPSHNLDTISRRLNIEIAKRHRAYDDAASLWEIIKTVQKKFPQDKLEHIISQLIVPAKKVSVEKARSQMGMLI